MRSRRQQSDRKTGIDILGNVRWGSHFCLFYETEEDLIDILVPYFKAGLENNEFCMWVTSEPLNEQKAKGAWRGAISDFDRYLRTGQIEIIPHSQWYLEDGRFNLQRVLKGQINKINQALKAGFDGIRITGNSAWLEKTDWENFPDYESQVNVAISQYRMIAICTYCSDECSASDIVDVVSSHESALIRKEGRWDVIENSERKKAQKVLQASKKKYRTLLENIPQEQRPGLHIL